MLPDRVSNLKEKGANSFLHESNPNEKEGKNESSRAASSRRVYRYLNPFLPGNP